MRDDEHTDKADEEVEPPEETIPDLSPDEAEQNKVTGGHGGKGPPNGETFV